MRRVAVTGAGAVSALGDDWLTVKQAFAEGRSAVRRMYDLEKVDGLGCHLGAPVTDFEKPPHFSRKQTRSMGRNALMAVTSAEQALSCAGLLNDPVVRAGRLGVSFGSTMGSADAAMDFVNMDHLKSTRGINGTTFLRMMSHTAVVNIGVFFGATGRIITTSSACTAGSQGIGSAYEAIAHGLQDVMIAGGAEELTPSQVAVFDTLLATSTRNDAPESTPRPFDAERDGLVIGEGACALILEAYEHAKARGAPILGEVMGYATNSDGRHLIQPDKSAQTACLRLALHDGGLTGDEIGYVNAHGTGTLTGDHIESQATRDALNHQVPISSLKGHFGHTLGACGALEAWMTLNMLTDKEFAPTLNLAHVDNQCADLDYIVDAPRKLDIEYAMSNNFAFGGINTSLILRAA